MPAHHFFTWLIAGTVLGLGQAARAEAPRRDGHGDTLPPGALTRIGTTRFRHRTSIYSLAYSPDGKLLAGGDTFESPSGSSIAVWDAATGRRLHRLEGHGHVVRCLAFAPDSKRLAAGCGDGALRIWDVTAEKVIAKINVDFCCCAAFTPDGKVVATSCGKGVGLWDAATGRQLAVLAGPGGTLRSVAVSPDGKQIATCTQFGTVFLFDRISGKELRRFQIASRYGGYVAFSPDGKRLVCGGEETICLWDAETGKEIRRIRTPDCWLCSRPFLRDGKVLVSYKEEVRFWDTATGEEIRRIDGGRGGVSALALSPDGKIAVTGGRRMGLGVRRWDTATGREIQGNDGHDLLVSSVAFAPDGKEVATASYETSFRLWDAASGRTRRTFTAGEDRVCGLAFSPDGGTLAGSIAGLPFLATRPVALWDVKNGSLLRRLGKKNLGSKQVAFSADGATLAASLSDTGVALWDIASAVPRPHPFKGERDLMSTIVQYPAFALAPDGKSLAAASLLEGRPHLLRWDTAGGRYDFAIPTTPGGRHAPLSEEPGDFSPDGRRIVTREGKMVRVREAVTGRVVRTFEGHTDQVLCAAFAPDGRTLASAGRDLTIRLWDLATGRQRRCFRGHEGAIACIAFAPDGERLASGSEDTTALIWSLQSDHPAAAPAPRLSAEELKSLWVELGGMDAAAAERAIWRLVLTADQGVEFLTARIEPVRPIAAERIAALIAELDSDRFEVREKAEAELLKLGEAAIPVSRKTLERGRPSLELRRRIERILARLSAWDRTTEGTRAMRVIDVLEHIGTLAAQRELERLAGGVAEARLTREAKASLQRLARRSARK